jgi:ribA/ribD-fused uncharacterized protein
VQFEGIQYPSVEHAYQAAKSMDKDERITIRNAKTAAEAKRWGKRVKKLRPSWDEVKLEIMEYLIGEKFAPGTTLAGKLASTEPHELIEGNWWGDTFWGVCRGVGQNHLGKLLMKQRALVIEHYEGDLDTIKTMLDKKKS